MLGLMSGKLNPQTVSTISARKDFVSGNAQTYQLKFRYNETINFIVVRRYIILAETLGAGWVELIVLKY